MQAPNYFDACRRWWSDLLPDQRETVLVVIDATLMRGGMLPRRSPAVCHRRRSVGYELEGRQLSNRSGPDACAWQASCVRAGVELEQHQQRIDIQPVIGEWQDQTINVVVRARVEICELLK
jgi:hypothetical protein